MDVHRSQRLWLFVVGAVLLGVAMAGCEQYSGRKATALIEVARQRDSLVFPDKDPNAAEEFKIYKATQAQLLRSPFVLTAALRKPEINSLGIVQRHEADPVAWLQNDLEVSFPADAEIMQISLGGGDMAETAKLVNAIVDAYVTEVVEAEKNAQNRKLADLDRVLAGKEQEIRQRRTTLKRLGEELGTADKETLSLQMQLALQQLSTYREQLARMQGDLRNLTADRVVLRARIARAEDTPEAKPDRPAAAAGGPAQRLSWVVEDLDRLTTKLADAGVSKELQEGLKNIRQRVEEIRHADAQRSAARDTRLAETKEELTDTEVKISLLRDEQKELKAVIEQIQQQFEHIGRSSVELDMMQTDIENLEEVRKQIATRREALEIEANGRPRVCVRQRAEEAPSPSAKPAASAP